MNRSGYSRSSSGFSLVEILVGVAIAMIGMVVMFQTMQNWEGRKRTTAAGSDAQVAGSIGAFDLERDIRLAGFGFGAAAEMGCTVSGFDALRGGSGAAIPAFRMVPALITQGAAGAPDTLTLLYGNGTTAAAGLPYTAATETTKTTNNADGLKPGELFIAAESTGNCGLFETTGNPPGAGATVTHETANYTNYQGTTVPVRYNDGTAMSISSGSTPGMMYNLGPAPRLDVWQVSGNGRLQVANVLANTTPTDVAEGVVNIQAQYGFDLDSDGFIAQTVNADGNAEWVDALPTVPPTSLEWLRVRAIRFALLVRSQHYEQALVSPNPAWAGGAFTMSDLGGTTDTAPDSPNNWRRYRYRVYEAVVPLRNVSWGATS